MDRSGHLIRGLDVNHGQRGLLVVAEVVQHRLHLPVAAPCLNGMASKYWVVQKVEEIVRYAEYIAEINDLPLRRPYGLDDERARAGDGRRTSWHR
jgi:hypothetical protein